MLDRAVTDHLEKYFRLSRDRFVAGDPALAAFFGVTAIEEAAKVLILRVPGAERRPYEELRQQALDHGQKYFSAIINLIDQSTRFDFRSFPEDWQDEVWSWATQGKLTRLRNSSLYLRFRRDRFTAPNQAIEKQLAGLLVFMAGVAMASLDDYVEIEDSKWAERIARETEDFRADLSRLASLVEELPQRESRWPGGNE